MRECKRNGIPREYTEEYNGRVYRDGITRKHTKRLTGRDSRESNGENERQTGLTQSVGPSALAI